MSEHWLVPCVVCSRPTCTAEDACESTQLSTGGWVCSRDCWDKAAGDWGEAARIALTQEAQAMGLYDVGEEVSDPDAISVERPGREAISGENIGPVSAKPAEPPRLDPEQTRLFMLGVARGYRAGRDDERARCRELIVAAAEQLVEVQRRAGALSADWDPEQWRVEAEIIADRLLGESTR